MDRTYLFVPPEERSEVESLGAEWDSVAKCWYVDGEPPIGLARWHSEAEAEEYSIVSNDACVAIAGMPCPHCKQETTVICIHCHSGAALGQQLERFTVSDVDEVDEDLHQELRRWPSYRRGAEENESADFANHCTACGALIGDLELHSEPGQPFFDIVQAAADGAVSLVPLTRAIRLSGNEHFVIE